jgi:adenylate cyclase
MVAQRVRSKALESAQVIAMPDVTRQRDPRDRLDSWKEIAGYLRRGARTVQRWEREQGMPVHRLVHDQGSTVYAYKSELDAWWTQHGTALTALPQAESAPSVAVLPFADMSREKDQQYLCEGIAEEIINMLSRLQRLRVASRTASFQCRGGEVREIGQRLRVGALLEGSVRKSDGRVRVAVQLTDVETGYQLWSGRFDREMSDIFAVQDEIGHSVVEGLELTLTPEEHGALAKAPTRNADAYEFYLRGRNFYYRFDRRNVEFATQLFSRAAELDPAYALAHAGLADCWSYLYLYARRSDEYRMQAETASDRAVQLDPACAQAQASRGLALSLAKRDREAERAFDAAIQLDPNLFEAHYFYARHSFAAGDRDKAVHLYEAAIRIRPEDYQAPLLVAQSYEALGLQDQARESRRRGIAAAEEHLRFNPDDARAVYMAANGLVALGERARGREWANRALEMKPDEPMVLFNVACIYSMLGMAEEAVECLERAVNNGLTQKGWFDHDDNLDPLRNHPRFQALLRRLN